MNNIVLISCENPRYHKNPNHIIAEIQWNVTGKVMTTTLDRTDFQPHIQKTIERILNGEFGEVAPYVAPIEE